MSIADRVRVKDVKVLSDDWYLLKKTAFDYRRNDGEWQSQSRETYDRGNGATILLYDPTRRTVVLVKQFRYPAFVSGYDDFLIETPAGLLDNASPEERIRAETEEETGFRVRDVRRVFEAFMSPGAVTERIYFFIGRYEPGDRVSSGGGHVGEGEDRSDRGGNRRGAGHGRRRPHLRCQDHHAAAIRSAAPAPLSGKKRSRRSGHSRLQRVGTAPTISSSFVLYCRYCTNSHASLMCSCFVPRWEKRVSEQLGFDFGATSLGTRPPARNRAPAERPDMLMFRLYPGQDVPITATVDRTCRAYGLTAKPYDADQRHISLLSIGSDEGVTGQLIGDAVAAAAQVRSPAFGLAFDRIVSFRTGRPKPLVLLCGEGANRVVELVSGIAEALNGFGFGIRLRAGFVPHCTVLRDTRLVPEVSLDRPILSRMREFHLVQSTNGGRLRFRIGRWPLRA